MFHYILFSAFSSETVNFYPIEDFMLVPSAIELDDREGKIVKSGGKMTRVLSSRSTRGNFPTRSLNRQPQ